MSTLGAVRAAAEAGLPFDDAAALVESRIAMAQRSLEYRSANEQALLAAPDAAPALVAKELEEFPRAAPSSARPSGEDASALSTSSTGAAGNVIPTSAFLRKKSQNRL